ncbi:hypothetical protein DPMN_151450 [Dreissena polymorpha]|uniref:Uncharacterized protein n=1 Tax=Dreissena polymorpha TaxID=45954 RepID=A0A9D4FJI9_DREPO|nr:hypothetical protein DPMN_151450 [Dreissena polymorpha]
MISVTMLAMICIQDLRWWFSVRKIRKECIRIMKELREDFRTDCCCGRKVCTKLMAKLQFEKEQAVKDSHTCIICYNNEKTFAVDTMHAPFLRKLLLAHAYAREQMRCV